MTEARGCEYTDPWHHPVELAADFRRRMSRRDRVFRLALFLRVVMTTTAMMAAPEREERSRSLGREALGRFFRNKLAVVGLVVLGVLVAVCYGSLGYWMASQTAAEVAGASGAVGHAAGARVEQGCSGRSF